MLELSPVPYFINIGVRRWKLGGGNLFVCNAEVNIKCLYTSVVTTKVWWFQWSSQQYPTTVCCGPERLYKNYWQLQSSPS